MTAQRFANLNILWGLIYCCVTEISAVFKGAKGKEKKNQKSKLEENKDRRGLENKSERVGDVWGFGGGGKTHKILSEK